MGNELRYGSRIFDEDHVEDGSLILSNSMMFDSLAADELNIEIISDELGNKKLLTNALEWYTTVNGEGYIVAVGDIRKYNYGDPIDYYYDGELFGKYFVKSITRIKSDRFRINAISAVGLWINMLHYGGIYEGETAGNLINDIVGTVPVEIDEDVAAVKLYGHLPIASARNNLAQVLFAIGASIVKNSAGNPRFRFLKNITPINIDDDYIYEENGSVEFPTPATQIHLTEHTYYKSSLDAEISLFDNTDGTGSVNGEIIKFERPCYDLKWNDADLPSGWEHGANFARVTGTGVLTGKAYTHTTKVFSVDTGKTGELNIEKIDDKTLVSLANSANVAARVADYKGSSEFAKFNMVLNSKDVRPGAYIQFTDSFGDASEGFISNMSVDVSGILKAATKVIKNYIPSHFGNNYANVELITQSGTWTPPAGAETIRLVIAQGGQAGQNGFDGEASWSRDSETDPDSKPGEGGLPGESGQAGKILVVDIPNPAGTFSITIGEGGQPAEGSGAFGNFGGHSVVTNNGHTYSSNDGSIIDDGYRDVISGNTYGVTGQPGIAGGKGRGRLDKASGDVTYQEQTWVAGINKDREHIGYDGTYREVDSYGSYGSGAAFGANGLDGNPPTSRDTAGAASHGADAISYSVDIQLASAGWGGHGGGGASEPGYTRDKWWSVRDSKWITDYYFGSNARGGYHSKGTPGGNGFVLIYS